MKRFVLALLMLVVALGACAGLDVRSKTTGTDTLIATARDNGAQRCAPVELAMAESNNDYAQHALDEGNYYDAKHHAATAETNANLAIEKSPPEKCKIYGDRDGDGIKDNVDKCPDQPEDKDGFQDADGCPDPDNDNDGIPDKTDQCPNDPEDKDGFEDADGCPDPDNDKDGFLDKDDKCPNDPGVAPDGCPKKYNLIVVTEKKIEIKQTIYFDFNKSTIKPVSFALLNEVAQALADNPKIKIEIGGHTDSVGDDNFNLKLSQSRADSVRLYLVKRGIDYARLATKGYGETQPIADNRTAEGRAQNRRVEFLITER
ncbi:MAG TPA: OmpA family protein [Kofleriaceae bacterium]